MKGLPTSALLLGFLLAAALAPTTSHAAPLTIAAGDRPDTRVRLPDGRRINLRCVGSGRPTVILESGFGASAMAWVKVAPLLASTYRTCAYDRAGYGFSDPGPEPRDGAAIALDLDDALTAARISGPLILVGHSAGALYVRLFANRRPGDVVGLVLVDPSVEHQDARFDAVVGPGAQSLAGPRDHAKACLAWAEGPDSRDPAKAPSRCIAPAKPSDSPAAAHARLIDAQRPGKWRTEIAELDSLWGRTSTEIDAGRADYGDLPLIVLTADSTFASAPPQVRPTLESLWVGLHRELAARSRRGLARLVTGTSHMIILDRPDAVHDAVDEVARTRGTQEKP